MSVKKITETNSQKILNSDIYDITRFVDDLKKRTIDNVDSETLMVGMYGYMGNQFASLLQNSIVTASELSNEAIPTRAKFDRNVITHALSLGVKKVAATPSNMKILLMFPERALQANMIDGKFTLTADTPLRFDEFEFHTDYDITIKYTDLSDSTNGSQRNYVYTASYDMDVKNPISDLENPFLPPVSVFRYQEDNMIVLSTNIHQVYYKKVHEKVLDSDVLANKTISFSFEKQMSHFNVLVKEPDTATTDSEYVYLHAVYDGLYNQEIAGQKYCYYQYINSNTIRIRFDPASYQPPTNSDIIIECYTTDGAAGNFEYKEEKTIRLTSDKYTNLYCIIAQRDDEGATGGLDRQSVDELQHIIPKEALSRGSVTTLTDLKNFFNSLNNEDSVLHVFKKDDNILNRVYYVYNLMKDSERNIVPTNTIPLYIEGTRRDANTGKLYIESGTPFFYYKFGDGTTLPLIRDNYTGYLQQKIANVETIYSFYNGNDNTTYQGTPTNETLDKWFDTYKTSFDPDKQMGDAFEYKTKKPNSSYDFFENGSIYFKPYYTTNVKLEPVDKAPYDKWYYGTCRNCELMKYEASLNAPTANSLINKLLKGKNYFGDPLDLEIEWTEVDGNTQTVTHFPERYGEPASVNVVVTGLPGDSHNITVKKPYATVTVSKSGDKYLVTNVALNYNDDLFTKISAIRYYHPRNFDASGKLIGPAQGDCIIELPFKFTSETEIIVTLYAWKVKLSFRDDSKVFTGNIAASREFLVPDYVYDLSKLTPFDKKNFSEDFVNSFCRPYMDGDDKLLILDSINTIDIYSYDGQKTEEKDYSFDSISLTEGDIIRFSTYLEGEGSGSFIYKDPSTWTIGEILSIERRGGRITSLEVLIEDKEVGSFQHMRYNLPERNFGTQTKTLDSSYIVTISKISKFLYTTPMSIVLKDDPASNTHRITASYYLDIIDETRYQTFDCINSSSPIQFILPYIKTKRQSYLSDNRYNYKIKVNVKPNTGMVDKDMINRTQVLGVFYKNDKPIMYSIADYMGGANMTGVDVDNGIPFEFNLYTRPFKTSTPEDANKNRSDIVDDNNDLYIGPMEYINQLTQQYGENTTDAKQAFFDKYKCYWATANTSNARPIEFDPSKISLDKNGNVEATNNNGYSYYADTLYLNLNTKLKIFILYKYDVTTPKTYIDGLTSEYLVVDNNRPDSLYNSVPQTTMFKPHIPVNDIEDPDYIAPYSLRDMVLTNVYSTYQGINLLHDYSDMMNSYVTAVKTNDIFNPSNNEIESYIVNRVPCVRYFYWWSEERVNTFIKEMKKKITYVKDAITPLETTFGLDYKFFNTYGPSNMYHLTDDDGAVGELIDNVALTMTFRAKFYNESNDAAGIKDEIVDVIKEYLEQLDELDDIHFPNITTMIETKFSEYLIYFEFVSFNIYDALSQHVVCVEDMEMLSMVPEFLHVDTNDYSGLPYINIRLVTA